MIPPSRRDAQVLSPGEVKGGLAEPGGMPYIRSRLMLNFSIREMR